ncbi:MULTISPECIES: ATP-binding protein [Bacillaceae]|uniref:sensor histidine kinase n=1 Tax=Bacillaceae TaxID=186817 RepID=UPI001E325C46|nr:MULTISPECIES: ATP-binding protein [Bacillaceae]MCE4047892.1 HAMP domain-containing histidine kinase [Bacillus sp. Au-Bac7]MDL0436331.1 ATP-binding protein [Niallia sp. SS-2023]UPO89269.1 HAMP domain-containing histidine kinase [Niallia sp. Man26]
MRVRTRIQVFSTLLLIIMMVCLNTTIYFVFQKEILKNEVNETAGKLMQAAGNLDSATTEMTRNSLLRAFVPANGMIRAIDENNAVIFTSTKESSYADIDHSFSAGQSENVLKQDGSSFAVASLPVIWNDGSVVKLEMAENIDSSLRILDVLRLILIIGTVLVILPTFLAGRLLSSFILTPIQSLIKTMEEIQSKGSFQKLELQDRSKDELYQLGNTFNKMISILELQYDKQKQFVYDASHELKTPLTVIESYASMLKRWGKNKPDALEEGIDAILSEAVRMKEMTNEMLELAKADDHLVLHLEDFELNKLCIKTAKNMEMATGRIVLVEKASTPVILYGDKQKIKQLLLILLDNAFKYGANTVKLAVNTTQENIILKVEDDGIGIDKKKQPLIFDRFYRADMSRNRENGGVGLGLSIAKLIMTAHDGMIEVESELDKGTTFTCMFPAGQKAVDK